MVSILRDLFSSIGNLIAPGEHDSGPFVPDYTDVCRARALLNALKLPTELALDILEYAQYWPCATWSTAPGHVTTAAASMPQNSEARLCIDIPVADNSLYNNLCSAEKKVEIKAIEFHIKSQDQGWTSERTHGTFSTSSWLEVSILRQNDTNQDAKNTHTVPMDEPYKDPRDLNEELATGGQILVKRPEHLNQGPQGGEGDLAWYLQGNRVASPRSAYIIAWTRDGFEGNEGAGRGEGFVETIEKGDRLLVWARSKWHGWRCTVLSCEVTVHYGF